MNNTVNKVKDKYCKTGFKFKESKDYNKFIGKYCLEVINEDGKTVQGINHFLYETLDSIITNSLLNEDGNYLFHIDYEEKIITYIDIKFNLLKPYLEKAFKNESDIKEGLYNETSDLKEIINVDQKSKTATVKICNEDRIISIPFKFIMNWEVVSYKKIKK